MILLQSGAGCHWPPRTPTRGPTPLHTTPVPTTPICGRIFPMRNQRLNFFKLTHYQSDVRIWLRNCTTHRGCEDASLCEYEQRDAAQAGISTDTATLYDFERYSRGGRAS